MQTHTHKNRRTRLTVGEAKRHSGEKLQSDAGNAKSCMRQSALKSNLTHTRRHTHGARNKGRGSLMGQSDKQRDSETPSPSGWLRVIGDEVMLPGGVSL